MAVWPSLKVVNSWDLATGIAVLRAMIFSTNSPMVSMPSDSGLTSSSKKSSAGLLPMSTSAWMPAPMATTRSGSISPRGWRPKNSATAERTSGMRVAPPTSSTLSMAPASRLASRSTRRQAVIARRSSGAASSANCAALKLPRQPFQLSSATSASLSASRARLAISSRAGQSCAATSAAPLRATSQSATNRSKSSPPRAVSPPVASTSNTPLRRLSSETSKVPPPRSNTTMLPCSRLSSP